MCDRQLAAAARKNCELLSLQSNSMAETRKTELASYLTIYALSDDLLRLRQIHDGIQELAKTTGEIQSSQVVDPDLEAERQYTRALQLEDTSTQP